MNMSPYKLSFICCSNCGRFSPLVPFKMIILITCLLLPSQEKQKNSQVSVPIISRVHICCNLEKSTSYNSKPRCCKSINCRLTVNSLRYKYKYSTLEKSYSSFWPLFGPKWPILGPANIFSALAQPFSTRYYCFQS